MTNKMVARYLFYAQELPSYSYLKHAKQTKLMKKIAFHSLKLVYGDQVFGNATKNITVFSRN